MENNGNENLPPSSLCKAGCGFFGSASFDGMCSKCFKDSVKRKQASPNVAPSPPISSSAIAGTSAGAMSLPSSLAVGSMDSHTPMDTVTPMDASGAEACAVSDFETGSPTVSVGLGAAMKEPLSGALTEGGAEAAGPLGAAADSPPKKKKTRCLTCKKKVGLTGFECRCGGLYCSLHRYSDKHNCTFDYQKHGADLIRKNNPVVVGEKVAKI